MTEDGSGNSSSGRQQQLDEILAELMRAIDAGEAINLDQWMTRHPEFKAELIHRDPFSGSIPLFLWVKSKGSFR